MRINEDENKLTDTKNMKFTRFAYFTIAMLIVLTVLFFVIKLTSPHLFNWVEKSFVNLENTDNSAIEPNKSYFGIALGVTFGILFAIYLLLLDVALYYLIIAASKITMFFSKAYFLVIVIMTKISIPLVVLYIIIGTGISVETPSTVNFLMGFFLSGMLIVLLNSSSKLIFTAEHK